jgi:Zn-finger nucleic acid-binding protein
LSTVTVDVCASGCAGLWFDAAELKKVDEAAEAEGEKLLDLVPVAPAKSTDRRACPHCADVVMTRHFTSTKKDVEIDECPQCGGVWLDTGELAALRAEYKVDANRKKSAEAYFSKLFDQTLVQGLADERERTRRREKFAHAFRLICPSYWIPGKQSGGAF